MGLQTTYFAFDFHDCTAELTNLMLRMMCRLGHWNSRREIHRRYKGEIKISTPTVSVTKSDIRQMRMLPNFREGPKATSGSGKPERSHGRRAKAAAI